MGSGGWLVDRERFFKKAWVLKTWVALFSWYQTNSKLITMLCYGRLNKQISEAGKRSHTKKLRYPLKRVAKNLRNIILYKAQWQKNTSD